MHFKKAKPLLFSTLLLLSLQPLTHAEPVRPIEELNLTPEGFKLGREEIARNFSLKPKTPVIPKLENGAETTFQVGDEVKLGYLPLLTYENNQKKYYNFLQGTIEKLIVDNGELVGFLLNRKFTSYGDQPKTLPAETYWLNEIDPDFATITKRALPENNKISSDQNTIAASSLVDPDNSSPIMFRYTSDAYFMAPVSVGDDVTFEFKRDNDKNKKELISGNVRKIIRNENGDPIGIKLSTHDAYDFHKKPRGPIDAEGLLYIEFSEIYRMDPYTRLNLVHSPDYSNFKTAGSRIRLRNTINSYAWLPGSSSVPALRKDTEDFTLNIDKGEYEAPVSIGDEVLLKMIDHRPDTVLGFGYERYLVLEIIYADSEPVGFRVEKVSSGDPNTIIYFDDFIRDDSYIETKHPWFGRRANKAPGAESKKKKYERWGTQKDPFDPERFKNFMNGIYKQAGDTEGAKVFNELFGGATDSGGKAIPPAPAASTKKGSALKSWDTSPVHYEEWLLRTGNPKNAQTKLEWARWVFQIDKNATTGEIKKRYYKLAKAFHPDKKECEDMLIKKEYEHAIQAINTAKDVLL